MRIFKKVFYDKGGSELSTVNLKLTREVYLGPYLTSIVGLFGGKYS